MNETAHTATKPARIFATVNGEVSSYPAGTRHLIGGWSTNSDSSRASEYVRGDIADDMLAALKEVRSIVSDGAMTGFNWKDGDWAERLYASQQKTSAAISKATAPTA